MSDPIYHEIRELDRDGAIEEAAGHVRETAGGLDGHTRSSFLRKAAVLAGGGLAAGAVPVAIAAGQSASPSTKSASQDIAILNFALTLEYLESNFYAEAVKMGKLSGETATFAKVVAGHEAAHVSKLQGALGSKAIKSPTFNFRGTTSSQGTFQKTAESLEAEGTMAYLGQAANLLNPAYLAVAGSILAVEARHTAWMADIIGHGSNPSPAPDAFQPAATMSQVLAVVKSLNFITGGLASAGPAGAQSGTPSMTG